MRLLYLVYGIIVLFGTTFFNLGESTGSGSSGYASSRGWSGGSSGSSGWSSGGGHK